MISSVAQKDKAVGGLYFSYLNKPNEKMYFVCSIKVLHTAFYPSVVDLFKYTTQLVGTLHE